MQILRVDLDGGNRFITETQPNLTNLQLLKTATEASQEDGGKNVVVGENLAGTTDAVYHIVAASGVQVVNNLSIR